MLVLGLGFTLLVSGREESYRIVVTFLTAKDNNITGVNLSGMKVVKQYGRRLVLDLGKPYDLKVQQLFFRSLFKSVQRVDPDLLVGILQVDIGQLVINDTVTVSPLDMTMNANNPDVDGVYIDSASQTPLWNLLDSEPYSIHAEGVWHVTNSTPDVVVAVIDTGMATPARGVFLNLMDGYDFISDDWLSLDEDERDPDATDPGDWGDSCPISSWHGTKVASILAARHDNEWGMKGIAQNCSVVPVRVLGMCRMGYASDVADAIVWAAGGSIDGVPVNPNPAKIISMSLAGKGECPDYLQSAITQAVNLGAIIIASAGNNNQNVSGYFPANCKGTLAIAASTRNGKLASYSNWGELIAIEAPGGDSANAIMTLSVNDLETELFSNYAIGTSFAAPHAAGVAALYMGYSSTMSSVFHYNFPEWDDILFFFSNNANLNNTQKLSGKGILSTYRDKKTLEESNNTYDINSPDFDNSFVFAEAVVPPGNLAGNILVTDPAGFSLSLPTLQPSAATFSRQCGAGQFICRISIYNFWSTTGFKFTCCDMNNVDQSYQEYCLSCSGFVWSYEGWFTTVSMDQTRFYTFGEKGAQYTGSLMPQFLINDGSCPGGTYVNGIYGSATGSDIVASYVICRPLFKASPAGYYSLGPTTGAGGGATACAPGTANANVGASSASACAACAGGTYSNIYAAVACATCQVCGAGSYWSSSCGGSSAGVCTPCAACPGGQYMSGCSGTSAGSCVNCQTCPVETYLSGCSGTSPGSCYTCNMCAPDRYRDKCGGASDGASCEPCTICGSIGKYTKKACTASQNSVCETCPYDCPSGQYRANCIGTSTTGSCQLCADCGVGNYRSGCNNASPGGCAACTCSSAGQYNPTCGGTSGGQCQYCPECPAGNYWSAPCEKISSGKCDPCPACIAGTFRTGCSGSSSGSCATCPVGSYCLAGSGPHTPCPAGTYSGATGASSPGACSNCPAGTYRESTGGVLSSDCTACPAGKYSGTAGASLATQCSTCPKGSYCPQGSNAPISCGPGKFSGADGATAISTCTICPQNSYCPSGATAASPCPAGTKGLASGASSAANCEPCPAGTAAVAGSTACTPCVSGTSWSASGAATCTLCSVFSCSTSQYKVDCKLDSDTDCARCPDPPSNALPETPIASTCLWTCNSGFYRSAGSCVACTTTSVGCLSGQYRAQCADAGTADGQCVACTNGPSNSFYTAVSSTGITSNCPYDCVAPYVKTGANNFCCKNCGNGNYNPGCTKTLPGDCETCNN